MRRDKGGDLTSFMETGSSPDNLSPSAGILDNATRLLKGEACVPTPFGKFSEALLTVEFPSKGFGGWFKGSQRLVFPVFDSSGETQQLLFQNLAVDSGSGDLVFTDPQKRLIDQYAKDTGVPLDFEGIEDQLLGVLLDNDIYVLLFDLAEDQEIQLNHRGNGGRLGPTGHELFNDWKFSQFIINVVNQRKIRSPQAPPPQFGILFTKHDRYLDLELKPIDKTFPEYDPYDIAGDRALLVRNNIEALTQVPEAKCLVSYTNIDPNTGLFNLITDGNLRGSVPDYPAEETYDELIQWLRKS